MSLSEDLTSQTSWEIPDFGAKMTFFYVCKRRRPNQRTTEKKNLLSNENNFIVRHPLIVLLTVALLPVGPLCNYLLRAR